MLVPFALSSSQRRLIVEIIGLSTLPQRHATYQVKMAKELNWDYACTFPQCKLLEETCTNLQLGAQMCASLCGCS